ncbi:uncharacterized protein LOC124532649 [Vanessa cardui]|uniref:uncharacterized protein LOC124532649 n=1 Tax=Vanessa cardui TaxID=171605 RepID=UPI001F139EC2|nr:uncharacterized protein LOC124532649 [Vanessa cardui]
MNNRESLREDNRNRAAELLRKNQENQNSLANQSRHKPRTYAVDDLVFVIKYSQSTGKLDPGMRGPYRVTKVLPEGRYELKLLSGSKGKSTQAAAQYIIPWKGEWCPETCAMFFDDNNNDSLPPESLHDSDQSAIAGPSMLEDKDHEGDQARETSSEEPFRNVVEDEPQSGEAE